MSDKIINLDEIRARATQEKPKHPIVDALDMLALALADHNHQWTDREVSLYETAVAYGNSAR